MTKKETPEKGFWDKLEIIGKVALPIVIAGATIWFNSQISARQQSAEMVKLAVGILSEKPQEDGVDPLRVWAIDILVDRGGLSQNAAKTLNIRQLNPAYVPTEYSPAWFETLENLRWAVE
ncbi:MAG: hypothetical protein AAFX90_09975 [Pseudomonadota bacterium]